MAAYPVPSSKSLEETSLKGLHRFLTGMNTSANGQSPVPSEESGVPFGLQKSSPFWSQEVWALDSTLPLIPCVSFHMSFPQILHLFPSLQIFDCCLLSLHIAGELKTGIYSTNVHSRIIHNSPKIGKNQMSINWWMNNQNAACPYNKNLSNQ